VRASEDVVLRVAGLLEDPNRSFIGLTSAVELSRSLVRGGLVVEEKPGELMVLAELGFGQGEPLRVDLERRRSSARSSASASMSTEVRHAHAQPQRTKHGYSRPQTPARAHRPVQRLQQCGGVRMPLGWFDGEALAERTPEVCRDTGARGQIDHVVGGDVPR